MDWLKFNANLNLNDSLMKFYATEPWILHFHPN